ncbi:molybdopterin molybdotransferase MoeA [Rhodobium gokarnense]|uniref:Molybdopterin molybdenumtransferase n=1 Tax=Rhodobium gokarnense TaxID=364296 RepID=A0ABT3HGI4_9HYPH|nr:gephyrin-like molybdotransferase Glp [Rhodobium gokarnense]MCW2309503.1 molybdopterin molybdotransferase [Rhodobium gokarnense]
MPPNNRLPDSRLKDDCFATDRECLTHGEALALLEAQVGPVVDSETVPLAAAGGRVLAEEIVAPRDVPLADNTAVDGYAFSHADYVASEGRLPVSMRIAAGHPAGAPLAQGTAAQIFTGAVMPPGADTVAMQEDCRIDDGEPPVVNVPPGLKQGANRRRAGEDVAAGSALLTPGLRLRPQDVGAIASTGKAEVTVYRRLRAALVSTGDEIVRPGNPIAPGQVFDANHYLLSELLAAANVAVSDLGVLADDPILIRERLAEAASSHDVLITSGGVSHGGEDHLADAVAALGSRHLWQLAIKPGRPVSFGQIGDCIAVGLPGNPVAAFVCFLNYAMPVLSAMGGAGFQTPIPYRIPAAFDFAKKPGRREFLRGILNRDADGHMVVKKFARDGSALISSLREADGLILLAEDTTAVAAGDVVEFVPFSAYGIAERTL